MWTGCLCTGRGYEAYNLGDGQPHPVEVSTPALQTCDAAGADETSDFLGVVMHELGHALGMNHANFSVDQCHGGLSAIGDTQGIMRTGFPTGDGWHRLQSRGRRLHADDLEGMIAFFDSLEVPWRRDFRLNAFESTDGGVTWGAGAVPDFKGFGARTRPAVTSAADESGFQAVAFTTGAGDVVHFTRDAEGFHDLPVTEAIVPGAFSRFPVAIAYGGGRLMVAWLHQESFSDKRSNVRWAIRDVDGRGNLNWTSGHFWSVQSQSLDVLHKEIGLGFDPGVNQFLVSAISGADSDVLLFMVDPVTAGLTTIPATASAGAVVRSVSKPVCYATDPNVYAFPSHCALTAVAALAGGPEARLLNLALGLNEDPPIFLSVEAATLQPLGFVDYGLVDLAADPRDDQQIGFVGAWTRAESVPPESPVRFEILRTATLPPADPLVEPPGFTPVTPFEVSLAPGSLGAPVLPAWPVAIGSRWSGGVLTYSAWRVDPDQEDEAPPVATGGIDPTDGACQPDATSSSTGASSTSMATDEPPATSTGGGEPPGCGCDARSGVPAVGTLMLALARRRRRKCSVYRVVTA